MDTRGFLAVWSALRCEAVGKSSLPMRNATREDLATMDQSDIGGLVTAFHRSVAGLPRSSVGDHRVDAHVELPRVPLIVFARRVADRE